MEYLLAFVTYLVEGRAPTSVYLVLFAGVILIYTSVVSWAIGRQADKTDADCDFDAEWQKVQQDEGWL